jgi:phosphoribosyl-ATP pyrophosphohydrolase/phosphoribosyl-AMP cyclohydrolase
MSSEIFARLSSPEALLPAIVQDAQTKDVLMLAWVNAEALKKTIETRRATFLSRSRLQLWTKGETSGNFQEIVNIKFDCDADSLLFAVQSHGPACHTGERTCFYREIESSP